MFNLWPIRIHPEIDLLMNAPELYDSSFDITDVRRALKQWHNNEIPNSPLEKSRLFQRSFRQTVGDVAETQRIVLRQALDTMVQNNAFEYQILDLRFVQQQPVLPTAHQLNIEESTFYKKQHSAIHHLTLTLNRAELALQQEALEHLHTRLEPQNYAQLFGINDVTTDLIALIQRNEPPWLFMLNGLGGIGKTTLADTLLRQLVEACMIDNFAWLSARQERFSLQGQIHSLSMPALTEHALVEQLIEQVLPTFPLPITAIEPAVGALRQHLALNPHFVVIDNLETVVDVEGLLPILRRLANPSQFMLTSRRSLHGEPDIFHLTVPGLAEEDVRAMIRHEATIRNLPDLVSAPDRALHAIYTTVGGNPLALRLVIGQTHIHSLDVVLGNLRAASGATAENLYTFIYENAWQGLDEGARRAFLAMPLAPTRGADLAYLMDVSALALADMTDALSTLVTLNLVDARGPLNARRYSIHNLTRSFLQEQVARWL